MDKIKLKIPIPEIKTIEYNNVQIQINPYIGFSEQILLINEYLNEYFGYLEDKVIERTTYHYLEAELKLMNRIIQLNTNIDLSEIDNNIYSDANLWYKISSEIINYKQFRLRLDGVVAQALKEEGFKYSIGRVISDLVEKANALIEKFSNMNPEELKQMGQEGINLIERLEKSSLLNNPSDKTVLLEQSNSTQEK